MIQFEVKDTNADTAELDALDAEVRVADPAPRDRDAR